MFARRLAVHALSNPVPHIVSPSGLTHCPSLPHCLAQLLQNDLLFARCLTQPLQNDPLFARCLTQPLQNDPLFAHCLTQPLQNDPLFARCLTQPLHNDPCLHAVSPNLCKMTPCLHAVSPKLCKMTPCLHAVSPNLCKTTPCLHAILPNTALSCPVLDTVSLQFAKSCTVYALPHPIPHRLVQYWTLSRPLFAKWLTESCAQCHQGLGAVSPSAWSSPARFTQSYTLLSDPASVTHGLNTISHTSSSILEPCRTHCCLDVPLSLTRGTVSQKSHLSRFTRWIKLRAIQL